MRKLPLIILFALAWPVQAKPSDSLINKPANGPATYMRLQYAGNLGLFSAGYGRTFFNNHLFVDLGYGFLPKSVNGAKVHTLALKNTCHFYCFRLQKFEVSPLIGASLTYSIAPNTYLKYPDYYPEGYYMPNALHLLPFVGLSSTFSCRYNSIQKISLYSELGTVDYKLWYSFNSDYVKFSDIWNTSFGVIFHLNNE